MKHTKSSVLIHIMPHFHFDLAYIQTPAEYLARAMDHIHAVLDQMQASSQFKFLLDQTILLETFKEHSPKRWKELQERVAEGRIELVGGGHVMPDTNLPGGEFLIRNFDYGLRFIQKHFNIKPRIGWMIDVFGHNAQIPQIMRQCGFESYCMGGKGMPVDGTSEFRWVGLDGSVLPVMWMPLNYSCLQPDDPDPIATLEQTIASLRGRATSGHVLVPNGSDCNPPDTRIEEIVQQWNEEHCDTPAIIDTPSGYADVVLADVEKLPTIHGELMSGRFWWVHPGCASSRMWVKTRNRRCENLILSTETYAAMAWMMGGHYPEEQLETMTRSLFFIHMHDVIAGTCIDEVFPEVCACFDRIEKQAEVLVTDSMDHLAGRIDTSRGSSPVVVFNDQGWRRSEVVEVPYDPPPAGETLQVTDADGRAVLAQINQSRLLFLAEDVPPIGWKVFYTHRQGAADAQAQGSVTFGQDYMENQYLHIALDRNDGTITRLYDKQHNKEVTPGGMNQIVGDMDVGDLYYHKTPPTHRNRAGQVFSSRFRDTPGWIQRGWPWCSPQKAEIQITGGPLQAVAVVRNSQIYRGKPLLEWTHRITLAHASRRIDFHTTLINHVGHIRLRAVFPTHLYSDNLWTEIPMGAIARSVRPVQGQDWHEAPRHTWPVQNWADLGDGVYGLTLINLGIPEHQVVDNKLYLTLLRSVDLHGGAEAGNFLPTPDALEPGEHEYRYALYPHAGTWQQAKSYQQAYAHNRPLHVLRTGAHGGEFHSTHSFAQINDHEHVVTEFRKHLGEDSIEMRLFQTTGRQISTQVTYHLPPHPPHSIPLNLRPYEIKTVHWTP